MRLQMEEVRRITGPNLLSDSPGAWLDAWVSGVDKQKVCRYWSANMEALLEKLGWTEKTYTRIYADGISVAISAPFDILYAACDAVELAWLQTAAELHGESLDDFDALYGALQKAIQEEQNPVLLNLIAKSEQQGVAFLTDDDEFSLGMGTTTAVWPVAELPEADSLSWGSFKSIPVGLITGTNGKSTCVRLAAAIAAAAGLSAGVTSTDFIRVGEKILDTGDYSGPGGARMLLRHPETEMAFLEVARGGILRRGLPVTQCQAALITNIAADHLGQYGINTVSELAEAKFVVDKGLAEDGILILNADDPELVRLAPTSTHHVCWFSLNKANSRVQAHLLQGLPVCFYHDDQLHYKAQGIEFQLPVDQVTISVGGTAKYNIANALGVLGLVMALKLPLEAVQQGMQRFGKHLDDNPGRGNICRYRGAQVIVDFAHNQHGMRGIVDMALQLSASRKKVMFGLAGDRSDSDMRALVDELLRLSPDQFIIAELKQYLRGRKPGEVPRLVQDYLWQHTVDPDNINVAENSLSGAKLALSDAKAGDLILLFVFTHRDQILALFNEE